MKMWQLHSNLHPILFNHDSSTDSTASEIWWIRHKRAFKVSWWTRLVRIISKYSRRRIKGLYLKIIIFGFLSILILLTMKTFRFVHFTVNVELNWEFVNLNYLVSISSTIEVTWNRGIYSPSARWFSRSEKITILGWNGCSMTCTRSRRIIRFRYLYLVS